LWHVPRGTPVCVSWWDEFYPKTLILGAGLLLGVEDPSVQIYGFLLHRAFTLLHTPNPSLPMLTRLLWT
jgi:hypothetical protein